MNKDNTTKAIFKSFLFSILMIFSNQSSGQIFASMVGIKASHNTVAVSGKIALSEFNYVEGGFGLFVDDPVALGPSAAFHRHFMLSEDQKTQFYVGPSLKGAIGDANSLGFGVDIGLTYIYKKINIGLEANPTYFLNDKLGFQPIYGLHLRIVNY